MDQDGAEPAGDEIVGHDAPASPELFRSANDPGLQDVEEPEKDEGDEDRRPGRRDEEQGDELAANLVDDDRARVRVADDPGLASRGGNGQEDEGADDGRVGRPGEGVEKVPINEDAGRAGQRSRRDGEVPEAEERRQDFRREFHQRVFLANHTRLPP